MFFGDTSVLFSTFHSLKCLCGKFSFLAWEFISASVWGITFGWCESLWAVVWQRVWRSVACGGRVRLVEGRVEAYFETFCDWIGYSVSYVEMTWL